MGKIEVIAYKYVIIKFIFYLCKKIYEEEESIASMMLFAGQTKDYEIGICCFSFSI
jgi:uncharacterized protein YaaR (DUF327 family)